MTYLVTGSGPDWSKIRTEPGGPPIEIIRYVDLELDWRTHRATRGRRTIHLSLLDLKLMRLFMLAPGQVFTRTEILEAVWPIGIHVCDRTVDVHMAALRKALHVPHAPNPVRTVRGRGYSLDYMDDAGGPCEPSASAAANA